MLKSEPRLPSASRTPSHKHWNMHLPAQSQEHVRLNDVRLQGGGPGLAASINEESWVAQVSLFETWESTKAIQRIVPVELPRIRQLSFRHPLHLRL